MNSNKPAPNFYKVDHSSQPQNPTLVKYATLAPYISEIEVPCS